MSEVKDIIDSDIYQSIIEFQKLLYKNVITGLLGYSNCKNKEYVKAVMLKIIQDITDRVEDLDRYINKYSV